MHIKKPNPMSLNMIYIMVIIKSRGEIRKEKDRKQKAIQRADVQFKEAENSKLQDPKKISVRLKRDHEAEIVNIPLRVLEMNEEFDMAAKEYATWPLPLTHFIRSHILIIRQNWGITVSNNPFHDDAAYYYIGNGVAFLLCDTLT
ncbi:hypothetical protein C2G38_2169882 [Gigaspora rosea]|uniref:Uncharacterized protein n=1 Tax=Gigaspora rosea TaxID=44941 RepID=A0A397VQC1_9GLOM|nr:hypothetical protein C2G38_2169882 [Gigaspora rosea]